MKNDLVKMRPHRTNWLGDGWFSARIRGNLRLRGSVVIAVLSLGACAQMPSGGDDLSRVKRLAEAHYGALVDNDIDKSYDFVCSGQKQVWSKVDHAYKYGGARHWREFAVSAVDCEDNRCEVDVSVEYEVFHPRVKSGRMRNTRPITEVWIKQNSRWCLFHDM